MEEAPLSGVGRAVDDEDGALADDGSQEVAAFVDLEGVFVGGEEAADEVGLGDDDHVADAEEAEGEDVAVAVGAGVEEGEGLREPPHRLGGGRGARAIGEGHAPSVSDVLAQVRFLRASEGKRAQTIGGLSEFVIGGMSKSRPEDAWTRASTLCQDDKYLIPADGDAATAAGAKRKFVCLFFLAHSKTFSVQKNAHGDKSVVNTSAPLQLFLMISIGNVASCWR
jgi:hypothetical protein